MSALASSPVRRHCSIVRFTGLASFSWLITIAHGAAITTEGSTLELPKLTVTDTADLPAPESWRYAQISGFEVLSNATDKETKRLLADFQKFQQAVRLVWPAPLKPLAGASIILTGRQNKFDTFLPAGTSARDSLVPSVFLRNREQIAIVVDLQTDLVTVDDPLALLNSGGASVEYQVDHYQQLYREYVHYLLSQGETRPPAWLEEGLAQIIMDIDLRDKTLIYGKIDSNKGDSLGGSPLEAAAEDATVASAVVGEQPFNVVLNHRPFIPFAKFLAISHDSPEASTPLGNNLWAKQAYAFVHFCLFGENLRHKDALSVFVVRLAKEPLSESLFNECFKVGYKDMEKQLRSYLRYTKHKYQQYNLTGTDRLTAATIDLVEASTSQVGQIKGDALLLAGKTKEAYAEYRLAYQWGGREASLLAGLGATAPEPELAEKFTAAAVKAEVKRPSAYVAQARQRLTAFKADPGPDGKLTAVQVAAVLTPLFKARSLPPRLPETYETIAETWAASSVSPKPEHLAILDEGIRQFPRNSSLLLQAARLYQVAGAAPTATAIAQLGLRYTTASEAKKEFEQLLATLPAAKN